MDCGARNRPMTMQPDLEDRRRKLAALGHPDILLPEDWPATPAEPPTAPRFFPEALTVEDMQNRKPPDHVSPRHEFSGRKLSTADLTDAEWDMIGVVFPRDAASSTLSWRDLTNHLVRFVSHQSTLDRHATFDGGPSSSRQNPTRTLDRCP